MKNVFKAALFMAVMPFIGQSQAQTHKDSTLGHKINKTATKVGHKTSHIAASGFAAVVDRKYKGKCGPGGQTVYINKYSHYYYINKKGRRIYIKKSQLKDGPPA